MQIDGYSNNHGKESHKVTNCLWDHAEAQEKGGGGMSLDRLPVTVQKTDEQLMAEGKLSLSAWGQKVFGKGKSLWASVWGEGSLNPTPADPSENALADDLPQVMAQLDGQEDSRHHGQLPQMQEPQDQIHLAQQAAASAMVQPPDTNSSPYFAAVEDTGAKERNVWEKVKVKFQAVSGYLTRQFSGKDTFEARQEKPRQDMRKRSRYHGEDDELDCVLTDDTYLLDSYDNKGEFRQLSPKK